MITKAKYSTTCFSCAQSIEKGDDIDYGIDKSIRHLVCPRYCDECGIKLNIGEGDSPGNHHKFNCKYWRPKNYE
jgi:hypothetical protein